jgi:hypothetical protein
MAPGGDWRIELGITPHIPDEGITLEKGAASPTLPTGNEGKKLFKITKRKGRSRVRTGVNGKVDTHQNPLCWIGKSAQRILGKDEP